MLNFIDAKSFVDDPEYDSRKTKEVAILEARIKPGYDPDSTTMLARGELIPMDPPVIELARGYMSLPHCYMIQTCYGHFNDGSHPFNTFPVDSLPEWLSSIQFREAFWLCCLQNNELGHKLFDDLAAVVELNPDYLQFGSSSAFDTPNTYVLQVEPDRNKTGEIIVVERQEALLIESVRNRMFQELEKILEKHKQLAGVS